MAPTGKSGKHYTAVDKKIFLEILKKYKDIVEQKKSDGASLREKESAWNEIADKFNGVLQISETVSYSIHLLAIFFVHLITQIR